MKKYTEAFIDAVLALSDKDQSKIGERERELFGLSSVRLRSFMNNVCSKEDTKYLELGVYRGATLLSALYGNKALKAIGVDNFKYEERELKRWASEGDIWPNMKTQLTANIDRYKEPGLPIDTTNLTMIQDDFENIDYTNYGKFNVIFFDISAPTVDQYKTFFNKIMPALMSESIIIFSNYSNENHSKAINEVLTDLPAGLSVSWKRNRTSSGLSDSTKYYSGILILGTEKKSVK